MKMIPRISHLSAFLLALGGVNIAGGQMAAAMGRYVTATFAGLCGCACLIVAGTELTKKGKGET